MGIKNSFIKKLICLIIIIIIFDLLFPILSVRAGFVEAFTEWVAKKVFASISWLLVDIGDILISKLQEVFMGDISDIRDGIKYSPGIIFSGEVPAFDANFITPSDKVIFPKGANESTWILLYHAYVMDTNETEEQAYAKMEKLAELSAERLYGGNSQSIQNVKTESVNELEGWVSGLEEYEESDHDFTLYDKEGNELAKYFLNYFYSDAYDEYQIYIYKDGEADVLDWLCEKRGNFAKYKENAKDYIIDSFLTKQMSELKVNEDNEGKTENKESNDYYNFKNIILNKIVELWNSWKNNQLDMSNRIIELQFTEENGSIKSIYIEYNPSNKQFNLDYKILNQTKAIKSFASMVKNLVATWYRAMIAIALVALLLILVYMAIRINLSITAEGKAKYKELLKDWLTAVCIIFALQFIMSFTFAVSESISDIFKSNVIGEKGNDVYMTALRDNIRTVTPDSLEAFANIVIYLTLVILTCVFTFQYMKRSIHIAFLVMIAPLIGFSYALDKIKDGQAQAFTLWLREFVFSVLIQPLHLIIYFMLVGVSDSIFEQNPVFAIVVIGFMVPAEKFIRGMFGFNKSEAVNTMGAAFTGAAVTDLIGKIGKKGSSGKGKGESKGEGQNNKIRTKDNEVGNSYDALKEEGTEEDRDNVRTAEEAGGTNGQGETGNPLRGRSLDNSNNAQGTNNDTNIGTRAGNKSSGKKIKGSVAGTLLKKYVANKGTAKKMARGLVKLQGRALLGTIGIAAGVATGDMKNVIAGGTAGIAAGGRLGANAFDRGERIAGRIKGLPDEARRIKYGDAAYERMKFEASSEYQDLSSRYSKDQISELYEAGIKDTSQMGSILDKMEKGNYGAKEALAYMKMAEKCPEEILYDEDKFKNYLSAYGISESKAAEIRKAVSSYK